MSDPVVVNPIKRFIIGDETCILLSSYSTIAIANNVQVIGAVAGKKIRVMGFDCISSGAASIGIIAIKDGNAGTVLWQSYMPPQAGGIPYQKPIADSGYFETSTGVGLYADVATANVLLAVYYITYTPKNV